VKKPRRKPPGGSRVTNEVDYLRMRRQATAEARSGKEMPPSLTVSHRTFSTHARHR
jgi:hypothetical protein